MSLYPDHPTFSTKDYDIVKAETLKNTITPKHYSIPNSKRIFHFPGTIAASLSLLIVSSLPLATKAHADEIGDSIETFQNFAEFIDESSITKSPKALETLANSIEALKTAGIAFAFLDLALSISDSLQDEPSDTDKILNKIDGVDRRVGSLREAMKNEFLQANRTLLDEFKQAEKRNSFNDIAVRYDTVKKYQKSLACYRKSEMIRADQQRQFGSSSYQSCLNAPEPPKYSDSSDDFFELGKRLGLLCEPVDNSLSVLETAANRNYGSYLNSTVIAVQMIDHLRKAQHVGMWMAMQEIYLAELRNAASVANVANVPFLSNVQLEERLTSDQLAKARANSLRLSKDKTKTLDDAWKSCEVESAKIAKALMQPATLKKNAQEFFNATFRFSDSDSKFSEEMETKLHSAPDIAARIIGESLEEQYPAHGWVVVVVENVHNYGNGCPGGATEGTRFNSDSVVFKGDPAINTGYIEITEEHKSPGRGSCGNRDENHLVTVLAHPFAPELLSKQERDVNLPAARSLGDGNFSLATSLIATQGVKKTKVSLLKSSFDAFSWGAIAAYRLDTGIYQSQFSESVFAKNARNLAHVVAPPLRGLVN